MSPWINYHHLYYFKTIAEEGTVSRAAEKLRLGQPTLSAQLKQFEDTLGVALFLRKNKRLELTEQGLVALDYAKSIFKLGSEMYEVLHDRIKPLKPSLHIGALDVVPKQVVMQIVKSALKNSPCQITLTEGRQQDLLRELAAHRMDLMVTNFLPSGSEGRGLYPRLISKKKVCIYGAPQYKSMRKGFPGSISGQPMIVPTYDSRMRSDLDNWFKRHGLEMNVAVESMDIGMKKMLATSGIGLISAASHAVTQQVLQGDLIEIGDLDGEHEELYLVSANRKIPNSIAAHLMSTFKL